MPSQYGEGKAALPAINDATVIFIINNTWKATDTDEAIYNATRSAWKISESVRERAVYALGVAGGVVRGAYRIDDWIEDPNQSGRWIFIGVSAPELNAVDKSVARLKPPQGQQTAVRPFLDGIPGE